MFIELTKFDDGKKILIQTSKVERISDNVENTSIDFNENDYVLVRESYEQVKALIQEKIPSNKAHVITEELLDEGSPFETNIIEAWTDKCKGFDRMAELQKKNRKDGFAYQITTVEVKTC